MRSVVIYASHKGNTREIAERMALALKELGEVALFPVEDAPAELPPADLVLLGGPTEGHTMTNEMSEFLDRLAPSSVVDERVAAFDTRVAWPELLSGSAARQIAKRLQAFGVNLCAPPESFIVTMEPKLRPGELERAAQWARQVAAKIGSREPVGVAG
jgi:flavodoxin